MLNDLALRADSAGHILLSPDELRFALSSGGEHYLLPIDRLRSLYKLTPLVSDLGLKVDHAEPARTRRRSTSKGPG
jgi:hypothetical protein